MPCVPPRVLDRDPYTGHSLVGASAEFPVDHILIDLRTIASTLLLLTLHRNSSQM